MDIRRLRQVRFWLLIFMTGLIISGLTAIPIQWEIDQIKNIMDSAPWLHDTAPGLVDWLTYVHTGLTAINQIYPFIVVGTDWLAFAHIVIAIAFVGPLRDPIRNVWVIQFGMIACVLVIPAALILSRCAACRPSGSCSIVHLALSESFRCFSPIGSFVHQYATPPWRIDHW